VQRSHVFESAAGADHRERSAFFSWIEEETGIRFSRIGPLLIVVIEFVEDGLTGAGVVDQSIERVDYDFW